MYNPNFEPPPTIEGMWDTVEMLHDGKLNTQNYSLQMEMWMGHLLDDLGKEKDTFMANQNLARLYFLPCFLNAYDTGESEKYAEDIEMATRIQKRFNMLLDIACYCCKDVTIPLQIIARSAVTEWRRELDCQMNQSENGGVKGKRTRVWDRFPLAFARSSLKDQEGPKESNTPKKYHNDEYQVRFLALEARNLQALNSVVVKHHLEREKAGTLPTSNKFAIIKGKSKVSTDLKMKQMKTESGKAPEDQYPVNIQYEMDDQRGQMLSAYYVREQSKEIHHASDILYSCKGHPKTTLCIPVKMGFYADKCGEEKYRISTSVTMDTAWGLLYMGNDNLVSAYKANALYSPCFELSTNIVQHPRSRFIKFSWKILEDYYGPRCANSMLKSKRTWEEIQPWIAGIVASQNDNFCRELDDSEVRSFRRMLLISDAMQAMATSDKVSWNRAEQNAINFEITLFGKQLIKEDMLLVDPVRSRQMIYMEEMFKLLKSGNQLRDDFLFEEKHFSETCYFVERENKTAVPTDFSPYGWMLNAAGIIADKSGHLHSTRTPEMTTYMFNEGFINMRSADSAYKMNQTVLDKCIKGGNDENGLPLTYSGEAAVIIRIDDYLLSNLCIEFPDVRVKQPLSGRTAVEVFRNRVYHIDQPPIQSSTEENKSKLSSTTTKKRVAERVEKVEKEKPETTLYGLEAFFKDGYPALFKKILKLDNRRNTAGAKWLIYKSMDTQNCDCAYDRNVQIKPRAKNEIDPIAGPVEAAGPVQCTGKVEMDELSDNFTVLHLNQKQRYMDRATPLSISSPGQATRLMSPMHYGDPFSPGQTGLLTAQPTVSSQQSAISPNTLYRLQPVMPVPDPYQSGTTTVYRNGQWYEVQYSQLSQLQQPPPYTPQQSVQSINIAQGAGPPLQQQFVQQNQYLTAQFVNGQVVSNGQQMNPPSTLSYTTMGVMNQTTSGQQNYDNPGYNRP